MQSQPCGSWNSQRTTPKTLGTPIIHCRIVPMVSGASKRHWTDLKRSYIGLEKRFLEECFEQS
jgi:hypothetical protein